MHWSTPLLIFAGPALMEWLPARFWQRSAPRPVIARFVLLQTHPATVTAATYLGPSESQLARLPDRVDGEAMAEELAGPARRALKGPIRVINGPQGVAGALAVSLTQRPLVTIDGSQQLSPWIPAGLVDQCGLVHIVRAANAPGAQAFGQLSRLIGMTLPDPDGQPRLVPWSSLRAMLPGVADAAAPASAALRAAPDAIYESAMRLALQVVVAD